MTLHCVNVRTGQSVFKCGFAAEAATPATGDVFVTPGGQQLRILQRAYIVHELPANVVDLGAPKEIDVEIQCACCPVGEEEEYRTEMLS